MNFISSMINWPHHTKKFCEKVIVIMGPTGSGKSRLSVDIATRIQSEIINSDKIQLYKGLDILANRIPVEEQLGIRHHLLGEFDSASQGELTPLQYRQICGYTISDIISRGKVPIIVGGSNSFIYALLSNGYNPNSDIFSGLDSVCNELRYNCCFLLMDVCVPVLNEYLVKRVDDMLDSGMMDELTQLYDEFEMNGIKKNCGLTKAIGVPEFEEYFRYGYGGGKNEMAHKAIFEEVVKNMKNNTCELAKTQIGKIKCLENGGWKMNRINATDSLRVILDGSKNFSDVWEKQVIEPCMKIVNSFLNE